MANSNAFVQTSKQRFEVAEAKDVQLGLGGTFKAEQIGTLGEGSGGAVP